MMTLPNHDIALPYLALSGIEIFFLKMLDFSLSSNYIANMDNTAGVIGLISTVRDKANKFILRQLRERGIENIVPAHGAIFVALFRNEELPMGKIAQIIDRDKSTVTALVSKLVSLGYLERRTADSDSRVTLIRLTEKGKLFQTDFMDISKNLLARVYDGFSDMEKEILMRLVSRVKKNL